MPGSRGWRGWLAAAPASCCSWLRTTSMSTEQESRGGGKWTSSALGLPANILLSEVLSHGGAHGKSKMTETWEPIPRATNPSQYKNVITLQENHCFIWEPMGIALWEQHNLWHRWVKSAWKISGKMYSAVNKQQSNSLISTRLLCSGSSVPLRRLSTVGCSQTSRSYHIPIFTHLGNS